MPSSNMLCLFFFNDTATTEIYTLSLHDALPIFSVNTINAGTYILDPKVLDMIPAGESYSFEYNLFPDLLRRGERFYAHRSEEHTSELQSRQYLVCRLLLEKKKTELSTSRR